MSNQKYLSELPADGIGDVAGIPRDRSKKNEGKSWKRFIPFFHKKAIKTAELTETYWEAEVGAKQAATRKILDEAAKLAADKKKIEAETDLTKQKEVLEFNKAIDGIFANDGLPDSAKILKLAKLIDMNPGLEKQVDKINMMIKRLEYTKGTVFQLQQKQKVLTEEGELLLEDSDIGDD